MSNTVCSLYSTIVVALLIAWNFCKTISTDTMLNISGHVSPPGLYKVMVWDKEVYPPISAECTNIFVQISRVIKQNEKTLRLNLAFFKYSEISDLDEYSKCFDHFYAKQSNLDGEFELKLSKWASHAIFIYIFPLNDNKALMRSSHYPNAFLQNVMRFKDWKSSGIPDKEIRFHNIYERNLIVEEMLNKWLLSSPSFCSKEDVFFLNAYLRLMTSRVVKMFTNGEKLFWKDLALLQIYGRKMCQFQTARIGTLEEKLAQIDTKILFKQFCEYLINEELYEMESKHSPQPLQCPIIMDPKMLDWNPLCHEFLKMDENQRRRQSLLEKLKITNLIDEEKTNFKEWKT